MWIWVALCISLCTDSSSSTIIIATQLGIIFSHLFLTAILASIYMYLSRLWALSSLLNAFSLLSIACKHLGFERFFPNRNVWWRKEISSYTKAGWCNLGFCPLKNEIQALSLSWLGTFYFSELFFIIGTVMLVIIIFVVVLSVSLHKCRKVRAERNGKENAPLNAA